MVNKCESSERATIEVKNVSSEFAINKTAVRKGVNNNENESKEQETTKLVHFFISKDRFVFPETVSNKAPLTTEDFLDYYTDFCSTCGGWNRILLKYIREFYTEDPVKYKYIKDLVAAAKEKKKTWEVVECIVWLKRNMSLICKSFQEFSEEVKKNNAPKFSDIIYKVYKRDLHPVLSLIPRQVYTGAICYLLPDNETLYKNLCYGITPAKPLELICECDEYLENMASIVEYLENISKDLDIDETKIT